MFQICTPKMEMRKKRSNHINEIFTIIHFKSVLSLVFIQN
jgi:hypothetical protein